MSEHAGEENQPTLVRSAFTLAESASDCSSVMFIFSLRSLSIALRPSSPVLATAWWAQVGSSVTSPSPPLPLPPRDSRPALRPLAARSFMVEAARSSLILALSRTRSSFRRWRCRSKKAVAGSGSWSMGACSSSATCSSASCTSASRSSAVSSRPSWSASSHASEIASSTALNLRCCPSEVLSEISSIESAIDSSRPVCLLRRERSCARISFCWELAASAM
jgi:hypothetical protein